jgi:hypothetical protein
VRVDIYNDQKTKFDSMYINVEPHTKFSHIQDVMQQTSLFSTWSVVKFKINDTEYLSEAHIPPGLTDPVSVTCLIPGVLYSFFFSSLTFMCL